MVWKGTNCQFINDYCAIGNLCNIHKGLNLRCESLNLTEQIKYNIGYRCVGSCPKHGFKRNANNACIGKIKFWVSFFLYKKNRIILIYKDINECDLEPSVCPNDSTCINLIGGYTCNCDDGLTYSREENACLGKNQITESFKI